MKITFDCLNRIVAGRLLVHARTGQVVTPDVRMNDFEQPAIFLWDGVLLPNTRTRPEVQSIFCDLVHVVDNKIVFESEFESTADCEYFVVDKIINGTLQPVNVFVEAATDEYPY